MSRNTGLRFAKPIIVFENKQGPWFTRAIVPQPGLAEPPAFHYYLCRPYCTGRPELGWAYYWKDRGTWNSTQPFHPPYKIGQRVWLPNTLHWYRITTIKTSHIAGYWYWDFILEEEL